jgi:hypothetical protein
MMNPTQHPVVQLAGSVINTYMLTLIALSYHYYLYMIIVIFV